MSGSPIEALDLAALLCSRVCHDLISPVGAIVNGLEVLAEDNDEETQKFALEVADRGPFALASIKAAFNARHGGVSGLARVSHDLLLRPYLDTDESHELSASFGERRKPDASKFGK